MSKDELKALAISLKCRPFYSDLYDSYVCGCAEAVHGISPDCTLLTEGSLERFQWRSRERVRDLLMPGSALHQRLSEAGTIDLVRVTDATPGSALDKAASRWGGASLILCNERKRR